MYNLGNNYYIVEFLWNHFLLHYVSHAPRKSFNWFDWKNFMFQVTPILWRHYLYYSNLIKGYYKGIDNVENLILRNNVLHGRMIITCFHIFDIYVDFPPQIKIEYA